MDYRRIAILAGIIILGSLLKVTYDKNKAGESIKETPVVKGVSKYVEEKLEEGGKTLNEVLGETKSFVSEQASKSASAVTSVVLEESSKKVVEQIEKLPKEQQEEIKQNICK